MTLGQLCRHRQLEIEDHGLAGRSCLEQWLGIFFLGKREKNEVLVEFHRRRDKANEMEKVF